MINDFEKWLDYSARYMSADRPDLWTFESAAGTLIRWKQYLSEGEHTSIGSGGFTLSKVFGDVHGEVEYCLVRNVADYSSDLNGETAHFIWQV